MFRQLVKKTFPAISRPFFNANPQFQTISNKIINRTLNTSTLFSLPSAMPQKINFAVKSPIKFSVRFGSDLAPRRRKYKKAQKGRVPVRSGGSQKGNFISFGDFGIRLKSGVRLSASVITACHNVIRRKVKVAKGTKIWLRVFPDIPVSSKGNESRMGKGKGGFEYWACRVPKDKILFEIAGPNLPIELAKEAFRLASDCLPVPTQFVDRRDDPLKAWVEAQKVLKAAKDKDTVNILDNQKSLPTIQATL